jgi:hypothetical protein
MRDFRILFTFTRNSLVEVTWESAEDTEEAVEEFLSKYPESRETIRIVNIKVMNPVTGNWEHPCPADNCNGTLRQDIDNEWYCKVCDWSTAQLD